MIYDWREVTKTDVYEDILSRWQNLLSDVSLKEQDYHRFLQAYPAVFLANIMGEYAAVSKLKLGSEYITDFVLVKEGYSDGTIYELIEIESPHTKLFDKSGKPTEKFNSALQQIRDWKRWLGNNRYEFHRIFPTVNTKLRKDSKLRFKIIIGKRTDDLQELEKRQQISALENVEIISFDRLTDFAKSRYIFFDEPMISSTEMQNVPYQRRNELANPFYMCFTDAEWRKLCYKGSSHFYTTKLEEILTVRKYNEDFEKFKNIVKQNRESNLNFEV